jgi:hypothetical protein
MNPFTERYKTLSIPDLLKIIDNPTDYQPGAVEAAENELEGRQLNDEELAAAKEENDAENQEKQIKIEKYKVFEDKVKIIGFSIADELNPIKTGILSPDKIISRISILFGMLFLFQAFTQFGLILFIFTDKSSKWDFSIVLYLLPYILLPLAVFLFWRRKKSGWILLAIFLVYSALITIVTFLMELRTDNSGGAGIGGLFPATSLATYLVRLFIYSGCLWLICKNNIREIYAINKQMMFISAGVGVAVTVISIWG